MGDSRPRPGASALSSHDTAIWHTCQINELLDADHLDAWPEVLTPFAGQPDGNRYLVDGAFSLADHHAAGDGSYERDNGFFFATGGAGLALTAGVMAGRAIGNARRRNEAIRAATARWREIDRGQIWVGTGGVTFRTVNGIFSWWFPSIDAAELVGPAAMWFTGKTGPGQTISWIVRSDWAELIFTLWARARHPRHPQLVGGAWVPAGWTHRVLSAGIRMPHQMTHQSQLAAYYRWG